MDGFLAYGHALAAMTGVALLQLLLSPLSALRKAARGLAPGAEPPQDYADACYRWHRAHGNLAESLAPFVAVTVAAILAGAPVFWVNLFAAIFFAVRVVLAGVHVTGFGRPQNGPRSFLYVGGWLMCLALGWLAARAVLIGD